MCAPCWALVPKRLGDLVYKHFNEGRRAGTHPNGAWMLAADAAIALVQRANGLTVRPQWLARAMTYALEMDGEAEAKAAAAEIIAAAPADLAELLRTTWALPC